MSHNYTHIALFEHRFWLQILGDHSRFILNSLSPKEIAAIQMAQHFISTFDHLLLQARRNPTSEQLDELNQMAILHAGRLREFKLYLLAQLLAEEIMLHLPPTFLNHMINELEEYLRILPFLLHRTSPPNEHPVHHHLLWLPDAYGHADTIACTLDPIEKEVREKSKHFTKIFEAFSLKAIEVAGYLRTNLSHFPALKRFNHQVELEIELFRGFILELEELRLTKEVLGTLFPLMADHMAREECYYLTKLAQSSELSSPKCDPTQPRTDG